MQFRTTFVFILVVSTCVILMGCTENNFLNTIFKTAILDIFNSKTVLPRDVGFTAFNIA